MLSSPPHTAVRRAGALRRAFSAWWIALALLCVQVAAPAAEAASSTKKSSSSSSKKKGSSSSKKKGAKKKTSKSSRPEVVRPAQRSAGGPDAVAVEGEGELGESDLEGDEDEVGGDPESELEAIERELLAQPPEAELEIRMPDSEPVRYDKPIDIKHVVIPGETVEEVATRYGVSARDVARWNGIKADKPIPAKKKDLRVKTTSPVAPRERVEHTVARGDTWDSVAEQLGVDAAKLRAWNPRAGDKLKPKAKLVGWRDVAMPSNAALAVKLAQIRVRAGGISIGKPSRGRLVRGVELPERPDLYVRRKPDEAYGSTHTVAQIVAAFTRFRHESNYKGPVAIGGMSRAKGGRFRPHKSHQSGRDVDIRLPLHGGEQHKRHVRSSDIDWKATWRLVKAFLDTGEVEYIFLDYRLQKLLYKAARESGATQEQLAGLLQWPAKSRTNKGVIRHVEGHQSHMHVRIRCARAEKHCYSSR